MKKNTINLLFAVMMLTAGFSQAQNVFTVTNTNDPNPKIYNKNPNDPSIVGSLQWAIRKSNDATSASIINFNIPGPGPHTISLLYYLPEIMRNNLIIDGSTQPGYDYNNGPSIIINGSNFTSSIQAFSIYGNYVTIKGLLIKNFKSYGIYIGSSNAQIIDNVFNFTGGYGYMNWVYSHTIYLHSNHAVIKGNRIGTDITGTMAMGSTCGAILIDGWGSDNNLIGGTNPNDYNIIAYNQKTNSFTGPDAAINLQGYGINNRFCRNIIFNNNSGFNLQGNNNKTAPVIYGAARTGNTVIVYGTSAPGDIVELFGSTGNQNANEYLTTITASTTGSWNASTATTYSYVIATATDQNNNTSAFSVAVSVPVPVISPGSTCTAAVPLPPATYTCSGTELQMTDSVFWMGFTADTTSMRIAITNPTDTPAANIQKLILYTGDCGTLQEIARKDASLGQTLDIVFTDFTVGDNYMAKVVRTESNIGGFKVCNSTIINPCLASPVLADAGLDKSIQAGQSITIGDAPKPWFTYTWYPSIGLNNINTSNPVATPDVSTTYYVTVVDANGCSDVDAVTVNVDYQNEFVSIGGIFDSIFDSYGNIYSMKEIMIRPKTQENGNKIPKSTLACLTNSGYFDIYFEQGSGMEGDTPLEIARRNVICQLFSDISSFITSPLISSNQKVNIWVRDIAQIPGANGSIPGLASSFYALPSGTPTTTGIADNQIWKTINSGIDAYTNFVSPLTVQGGQYNSGSGVFFHGIMAFNFNNFSWQTDLTQYPIEPTNLDLYTVALHELTHALGFASLIGNNGQSKFGSNYSYYSRYDKNLVTPLNNHLIDNTGNCSLYGYFFSQNPSWLTPNIFDCTTQIRYASTSINQAVFTPTTFDLTSSLSHLEDMCHDPNPYSDNLYYVMADAISEGQSFVKRYLKPEERNILCDIGYKVNSTYGTLTNNNYFDYGTSQCQGIEVVGVNDGITASGSWAYTIDINSISGSIYPLLNDFNNPDYFECLEVILGNGSVSNVVGTSFTFDSDAMPGLVLLRYIPVKNNQRGNITYIFIKVTSENCIGCTNDIVSNSDFENAYLCGPFQLQTGGIGPNCWEILYMTPDLFSRNCTNANGYNIGVNTSMSQPPSESFNLTPNDHFIGLLGFTVINYNSFKTELVQNQLYAPLIPNQQYQLSFVAKVNNGITSNTSAIPVYFGTSEYSLANFSPSGSFPFNQLIPSNMTPWVPNDNKWHAYNIQFIFNPSQPHNNLIIGNNPFLFTTNCEYYLFIDNVSIQPIENCIEFNPPETVNCDVIIDLTNFTNVPGGGFSGDGIVDNIFFASVAGLGSHLITYTVTDNNNCIKTVVTEIVVTSEISVTTQNITCAPGTATVTIPSCMVAPYTLLWSDGQTAATSLNSSTASFNTSGTYTVTVTDANGLSQTGSVVMSLYPTPIVTITQTGKPYLCQNQQGSFILTATATNLYDPQNPWGPLALYHWSNNVNTSANSITATSASLGFLTYYVTVTDFWTGCYTVESIKIPVKPAPTVNIHSAGSCFATGQPSGFFAFSSLSDPTASYTWNFGDGITTNPSTSPNVSHQFGNDGYYCVSVASNGVCQASASNSFYILPNSCACLASVAYDDEIDPTILNVNTTRNWGAPYKIYGTVRVSLNSTLSIKNTTIQFGPRGKIIVEAGSTLILENSILTNLGYLCDYMWQGVEVWGNGTAGSTGQGMISMQGPTPMIEKAHIGVLLGKRKDYNVCNYVANNNYLDPAFGGGIIRTSAQAENINSFNMNGIAIKFADKTAANVTPGNMIAKCNITGGYLFPLDHSYKTGGGQAYPNKRNPWAGPANVLGISPAGIHVIRNRGLVIDGGIQLSNSFSNTFSGIEIYNGSCRVLNNNFNQHRYGVFISNSSYSGLNSNLVENNIFTNIPGSGYISVKPDLTSAIYLNMGWGDVINNNTIGVFGGSQSLNLIGITIINSRRLSITDNKFRRNKYGIMIQGNDDYHFFYKNIIGFKSTGNQFEQTWQGVCASGDNSSLQIRCNNHNNSLTPGEYSNSNWLINSKLFSYQGKANNPAGNRFQPDDILKKQIRNLKPYWFYYYYNTDGGIFMPKTFGNINLQQGNIPYSSQNCLIPTFLLTQYPSLINTASARVSQYTNEFQQVFSTLDHGQTAALLNAINTNSNGTLQTKLVNASPLSDEVLQAVITKPVPLPPGNFKNVMERNLPVSDTIYPLFNAKLATLPNGIKNQLAALQADNPAYRTLTSISRDLISAQDDYIGLRSDYLNELIKQDMTADALAMLNTDNSFAARTLLSGTYASLDSIVAARQLVASFAPSTQDEADWKAVESLLLYYADSGRTIYDIDSTQLAWVWSLAGYDPPTQATTQAWTILGLLYGEKFGITPVDTVSTFMHRFTLPDNVFGDINELEKPIDFNLYPNPASKEIIVEYPAENNLNSSLEIFDVLGKKEVIYKLNDKSGLMKITVGSFASGIYYFRYVVEDEIVYQNKLIIYK